MRAVIWPTLRGASPARITVNPRPSTEPVSVCACVMGAQKDDDVEVYTPKAWPGVKDRHVLEGTATTVRLGFGICVRDTDRPASSISTRKHTKVARATFRFPTGPKTTTSTASPMASPIATSEACGTKRASWPTTTVRCVLWTGQQEYTSSRSRLCRNGQFHYARRYTPFTPTMLACPFFDRKKSHHPRALHPSA